MLIDVDHGTSNSSRCKPKCGNRDACIHITSVLAHMAAKLAPWRDLEVNERVIGIQSLSG